MASINTVNSYLTQFFVKYFVLLYFISNQIKNYQYELSYEKEN